jgi:hypothetical protein
VGRAQLKPGDIKAIIFWTTPLWEMPVNAWNEPGSAASNAATTKTIPK